MNDLEERLLEIEARQAAQNTIIVALVEILASEGIARDEVFTTALQSLETDWRRQNGHAAALELYRRVRTAAEKAILRRGPLDPL